MSEAHHQPTIRDESKIYSATGKGLIPFVSCDDVAAVTYRALVDDRSHNCDHVIYGRELLGYGDVSSPSSSILLTISTAFRPWTMADSSIACLHPHRRPGETGHACPSHRE